MFLQGILEMGGRVLDTEGRTRAWIFEIQFPNHETLIDFTNYCEGAHIDLEVGRLYNPTKPEGGMWFGLTEAQREALMAAVEGGYHSIPRGISTQDLADQFGISDQAVTERLHRAIVTLAENTLIAVEEDVFEPIEE